jgi:hypothetical protein
MGRNNREGGDMSQYAAKPEYEVLYQDLVVLLRRHADKMTAAEMLAVGANMLGKLIAMQDQRSMTREKALKIVIENMNLGNQQVLDQLGDVQGKA